MSLNQEETIKTLGIFWNSPLDNFCYQFNYAEKELTKRFVLSTIARIHDPMGLISPIIAKAKIFMKKIWSNNLDSDEPLPIDFQHEWNKFVSSLQTIIDLKIPRWFHTMPQNCHIQLHGFADASLEAYGAVIYLRCIDEFEKILRS